MKKQVIILAAMMLVSSVVSAQDFFRRIGEAAKSTAERKIESKVEEGVEDAIDGNLFQKDQNGEETEEPQKQTADGWTCPACGHEGNTGKFCAECGAKKPGAAETWTCPACGTEGNTGKFCNECGAKKPGAEAAKPAARKSTASNYAKSDFVPGDEVFFEDDFANEQLGEFPSRWDLMDGYAEVGEVDGRKGLCFTDNGEGIVQPLMKDQKHFLPDVFTVEYDTYVMPGGDLDQDDWGGNDIEMAFGNPDLENWNGYVGWSTFWFRSDGAASINWEFQKPNGGDNVTGEKNLDLGTPDNPLVEGWNHIAYSFNKRAFKGYVNGVRVINIPNAKVPSHFWIWHHHYYKYGIITNVRVAKGAVPLYDRLASDGKIITYAITFEVGKADLKPESMVEIMRIAKLMKENPNISFEVQGHCDASGSDKVNDPLSQRRAEAIVAALVEQGIAGVRLTAVGKGSHEPIADNKTEEGRAKNRRVEFVKK